MQLRGLEIPAGAVFAPMAGLTDAACRHLMAAHGAAWTVSEMVSAKALTFGDKKSLALARDTLDGGPRGPRNPMRTSLDGVRESYGPNST